jgi:hypothetical protein
LVFLYQGLEDVKIKNSPFSQYLPQDYNNNNLTHVKCLSIGRVKDINLDDYSLNIDWDKEYQTTYWYSYFRQDGV